MLLGIFTNNSIILYIKQFKNFQISIYCKAILVFSSKINKIQWVINMMYFNAEVKQFNLKYITNLTLRNTTYVNDII